jgi:UDP-GlcNAc:undecaprenyl-phosphate/decaprenyl-phosphate GlcNAc-1-phosphate transferase
MLPPEASALGGLQAISSVLFVISAAFFISITLTPLIRDAARARGFVDLPDGGRKLHAVAVPRFGGLAVYLSFAAAFLVSVLLLPSTVWLGASGIDAALHVLAAGGAVMAIGLLDDLRGVSPVVKVLVQGGAALYLYAAGFQIQMINNPLGGSLTLGWLSLPVTLLWVVGLSNAFNLIDGLDGLAAGVGLFALSVVFTFALLNEKWEIAILAVALAGALLGFLRFNFSPASVFLGDSGSLFVGFAVAALSIRGSMKSSTAVAVVTPLLALGFPIVDTALAMLRRVVRGKSILEADADHIHHRMMRRGLTPQRAVIMLYGVAALFGAMALLSMTGQAHAVGLAVGGFTLITWLGIRQLGYRELENFPGLFRLSRRGGAQRALLRLRSRLESATDMTGVWSPVTEVAAELGLGRIALSLDAGEDGPQESWTWRAPQPHAGPAWTWALPLVHDGARMGELTLARASDAPLLAVAPGEVERLAADLADSVARIRGLAPAANAPALRASGTPDAPPAA